MASKEEIKQDNTDIDKEELNDNDVNEIEGDIPTDMKIRKGSDILVIGDDQNWVTHGMHKYPAKYIPEFPRWAIKKYSNPGNVVLDPFSGSGTTGVEAMILGRKSYAIDIDPLALLLTKVKTTPLSINKLKQSYNSLLMKIKDKSNPNSIPEFKNRDHWFKVEVSKKLTLIKECIEEEKDKRIKDFFKVSFSAIVRAVSNADTGSHKPCVRKDINRRIPEPINKFTSKLEDNVSGMIEFSNKVGQDYYQTKIIGEDAKKINLENNSVNLVVTSPPYINALDYARTHKLEYYWLGYFNNSLVDLKKKFIGTEQVYAARYKTLCQTGIDELDGIIEKIFEVDKKRAYIVYKFYMDMYENLSEVYRILKNGSKYVMFIGNNQIRNITIQNYKYIKEMAKKIGFKLDNYFKSGIINHYIPFERTEKINKDHVLVLEK